MRFCLSFGRGEMYVCRYPKPVGVQALRGAIQVPTDSPHALRESVPRLLTEVLRANQVNYDQIISMFFTATPDLTSDFPAAAARVLPVGDIPLICAAEIAVPGALERVVRVMIHIETDKARSELKHIYLDGAEVLRNDIAQ